MGCTWRAGVVERDTIAVFLATLSVNLILSTLFMLAFGQPYGDALSRTANAYFVLFNNDSPKLTSMGSIWLPLPMLLQLPLVLFRPLATSGLAGGVVSSFFSALSVAYLNGIFRMNGLLASDRRTRYLLLGLYYLNPMILVYSINGMTEMILTGLLLGVFYHTLKWMDDTSRVGDIVRGGLLLSLAALVRYEGWFIAFSLVALMLVLRVSAFGKRDSEMMEGMTVLYALPAFYIIFLWLLYNWLIMGDPLHFARGFGSFSYQAALAAQRLPASAILLKAFGIFPFSAAAFLSVASGSVSSGRIRPKCLLALFFMGSVLAFNLLAMRSGMSFGWIRQFIYMIPFSMASLGVMVGEKWSRGLLALTLSLLLLSVGVSANSFSSVEMKEMFGGEKFDASEVVGYIESGKLEGVLVDTFYGYKIVLESDPRRFVDPYDNNFTPALEQPYNYSRYVLAFDALAMPDLTLLRYPSLARIGRPELSLVRDFGGGHVRLYRIERPFENGTFSVENVTVEEGIVQFSVQNYDDAQPAVDAAIMCGPSSESVEPFGLGKMERLGREEVAMPLPEGCDEPMLVVKGWRGAVAKSYKLPILGPD